MKTKKYGTSTSETEIKLEATTLEASDAFENVKKVSIKFMSKIDDNNWLFTIRHDIKYFDNIKTMNTVRDLKSFDKVA